MTALAFSQDGRLVLAGGEDTIARLFDASTGRLFASLPPSEGSVSIVAFSPDNKTFLTSSNTPDHKSVTRLWDLETQTVRHEIRFDGWIYSAAFSPDSRTILLSPRGLKMQILGSRNCRGVIECREQWNAREPFFYHPGVQP